MVQTPASSGSGSDRTSGTEAGSTTQQITVEVSHAGDGAVIVHVAGEIDLLTANVLGERIREQLDPANRLLVLDLSGVTFLGSAGLAEIVSASQAGADWGAKMLLVATNRAVVRPLEVTGLSSLFTLYASVDAALAGANE